MRQRFCLFLASFLTVSALAATGNGGGRTRRQVGGYRNPGYGQQERDINVVCDCEDYNRRRQYSQQGYNGNTNYPQNNGYGQYNNGYGQYNNGYGQYNTGYGQQQPGGGIFSMLSRMPLFG